MILLGIGTASTFPLTLLMIVLRASTPVIAGQLSAMVQGIGYLHLRARARSPSASCTTRSTRGARR